jgi:YhcH/YjgK/YiaL family protein
MILDTLSQAAPYQLLGPRFSAGFKWLAEFSPATADGRYDIDGDDVFALVQSYDTVPATEKKYESHRIYADIQYVAEGLELIYYAPTASLRPTMAYDEVKDCLLYSDPAVATPLVLEPGTFAIFFAQDGHKPGCLHKAADRIRKVVIKVRL